MPQIMFIDCLTAAGLVATRDKPSVYMYSSACRLHACVSDLAQSPVYWKMKSVLARPRCTCTLTCVLEDEVGAGEAAVHVQAQLVGVAQHEVRHSLLGAADRQRVRARRVADLAHAHRARALVTRRRWRRRAAHCGVNHRDVDLLTRLRFDAQWRVVQRAVMT